MTGSESWARGLLRRICSEHMQHDDQIMQGVAGEEQHALEVSEWVKRFAGDPSPSLVLAALFHDIDRVVNAGVGGGYKGDRNSEAYLKHKKAHARRSADYICPRLRQSGIDEATVERVRFLIEHHDDTGAEVEGCGDPELEALVAADSVAFFTTIAPRLLAAEGKERTRDKVRFMIEKMHPGIRRTLLAVRLSDPSLQQLKDDGLREFSPRS